MFENQIHHAIPIDLLNVDDWSDRMMPTPSPERARKKEEE
jgi:hypothetical protein